MSKAETGNDVEQLDKIARELRQWLQQEGHLINGDAPDLASFLRRAYKIGYERAIEVHDD